MEEEGCTPSVIVVVIMHVMKICEASQHIHKTPHQKTFLGDPLYLLQS